MVGNPKTELISNYPISNTTQNWKNKYWTAKSAIEFAQHWHWKSAEKNPKSAEGDSGGHGRYMTLQTAGYTWEDVIDNKVEESQIENKLHVDVKEDADIKDSFNNFCVFSSKLSYQSLILSKKPSSISPLNSSF